MYISEAGLTFFLPRSRPKCNYTVATLRLGRRVTLDRFSGGGALSHAQHKAPRIQAILLTR